MSHPMRPASAVPNVGMASILVWVLAVNEFRQTLYLEDDSDRQLKNSRHSIDGASQCVFTS